MESITTNSPSPISDNKQMDQHVSEINRISSIPVAKPPRKSLCWIKKNTVAGMVNRFTQKIESANDVVDRKAANSPNARQASFFADDFSTIIEPKLDSVDTGYDAFRRRSRSVNTSSVNNASRAILARYEKFPNFKFTYLKYFGVDPTEYFSAYDIDYDPVSDSIRKDSTDGGGGNAFMADNITSSFMRKRSQTVSSQKTFDSTTVKLSNSKYFATQSREEDHATKNGPMKVVATDRSDYEDVFVTKVAAGRDSFLKKSLRSVAVQTSPEQKIQSVGSDDVALCDKTSPKRPSKRDEDRDLISRIQQSIKSYDSVLKSLRKNGISKKKRAGFDAK